MLQKRNARRLAALVLAVAALAATAPEAGLACSGGGGPCPTIPGR
jgi:hypothetical protein